MLVPVSAGNQWWPVSFLLPLCSVLSVQEITFRWWLPTRRGYFTVSLATFNICFPCNWPLAFVRFSGGCSDGDGPCKMRSLLKLLATSKAWLESGGWPLSTWQQRHIFRSMRVGKIALHRLTLQKEGNKIPHKSLSVPLCWFCVFVFFIVVCFCCCRFVWLFLIPFKMIIAVWKRGLLVIMPATTLLR